MHALPVQCFGGRPGLHPSSALDAAAAPLHAPQQLPQLAELPSQS